MQIHDKLPQRLVEELGSALNVCSREALTFLFFRIIWVLGPYVDSAPDVIDVCFQQRQDGGLVHALSNYACLSSPAES